MPAHWLVKNLSPPHFLSNLQATWSYHFKSVSFPIHCCALRKVVHSQKALKFILLWRAPKQEFLLKPRGSSSRQSVTLIMWRPSECQFKLLLIGWVNTIILIVDWVIPENIHTIPQTYIVFIEMNIQCRHMHVAKICLL